MNTTIRRSILAAWLLAISSTAIAGHPTYLILRNPAHAAPHHAAPQHQPVQAVEVMAPSYAYGWFGAQPHRQWSRHFGYYRNYTQWSAR